MSYPCFSIDGRKSQQKLSRQPALIYYSVRVDKTQVTNLRYQGNQVQAQATILRYRR